MKLLGCFLVVASIFGGWAAGTQLEGPEIYRVVIVITHIAVAVGTVLVLLSAVSERRRRESGWNQPGG